jgi:Acetyltransferases, including N-acetylases of ribosomal proteins
MIETRRLLIRDFKIEDATTLASYRSKKEVAYYQSWNSYSLKKAQKRIAYCLKNPFKPKIGNYQLAIELKQEGKLIGDLFVEIKDYQTFILGYTLDSDYWSKGYALEAIKAFLTYQKEENHFKKVICHVYQDNVRSLRLLKKLGFIPYRKSYFYHDVSLYKELK